LIYELSRAKLIFVVVTVTVIIIIISSTIWQITIIVIIFMAIMMHLPWKGTTINQHIPWLDISMHNSSRVQSIEGY